MLLAVPTTSKAKPLGVRHAPLKQQQQQQAGSKKRGPQGPTGAKTCKVCMGNRPAHDAAHAAGRCTSTCNVSEVGVVHHWKNCPLRCAECNQWHDTTGFQCPKKQQPTLQQHFQP
jgi:hypothetical protein